MTYVDANWMNLFDTITQNKIYVDFQNCWIDHPVLPTLFVNNISDIKGLFKYLSK